MELSSVLKKVRALISTAEHPNTPPAEAQTASEMADRLMLKYAIDEALARTAAPAAERQKPGTAMIELGEDWDLMPYIAAMANHIASFTRCKIRHYVRYVGGDTGYLSKVYGFESDLRYFEILYTTIRLHMVGALRPKIDPSESLEDNCYRLHNAGYNWLQIAELYGWRKRGSFETEDPRYGKECWTHQRTDEKKSNWQLGSQNKRAYFKACKERGETPQKISAGGTQTYRVSAFEGYASKIGIRLRKLAGERSGDGAEIVLRSAMEDVEGLFREDNPDLFQEAKAMAECEACKKSKSGHCRSHRPRAYKPRAFSQAGYTAGSVHADSADLMAGDRVGGIKKAVS